MTKLLRSFVRQFGLAELPEVVGRRIVWLLVEKELLDEDFTIRLLGW